MRKLRMSELNRLSAQEFQQAEKFPIAVVLDDVRSILNVGSVFRTSDAFRIMKICLCGHTATPDHREMNKTALGATEAVHWQHYEKTTRAISDLKEEGFTILAIEQTEGAVMLQDYPFSTDKKIAFVFGNEVKGVSNEALKLCDAALEIPQFGTKHSFNISVSTGIVLWEAFQPFLK